MKWSSHVNLQGKVGKNQKIDNCTMQNLHWRGISLTCSLSAGPEVWSLLDNLAFGAFHSLCYSPSSCFNDFSTMVLLQN
jgi:hypothetical protein